LGVYGSHRNQVFIYLLVNQKRDTEQYAISEPTCRAGYWPFGVELCGAWQVMDVTMCTSSIMHMCTVSMDRYAGIRDPLKVSGGMLAWLSVWDEVEISK